MVNKMSQMHSFPVREINFYALDSIIPEVLSNLINSVILLYCDTSHGKFPSHTQKLLKFIFILLGWGSAIIMIAFWRKVFSLRFILEKLSSPKWKQKHRWPGILEIQNRRGWRLFYNLEPEVMSTAILHLLSSPVEDHSSRMLTDRKNFSKML